MDDEFCLNVKTVLYSKANFLMHVLKKPQS